MKTFTQGAALDEVSQTSLEVAKLAVEDAVARARGEVRSHFNSSFFFQFHAFA